MPERSTASKAMRSLKDRMCMLFDIRSRDVGAKAVSEKPIPWRELGAFVAGSVAIPVCSGRGQIQPARGLGLFRQDLVTCVRVTGHYLRKKRDRHVSLGDSLACISPFFAALSRP